MNSFTQQTFKEQLVEIDQEVLKLVEEYNKRTEQEKRLTVVEKDGKSYIKVDDLDNLYFFLKATDLRNKGYVIKENRIYKPQDNEVSLGVDNTGGVGINASLSNLGNVGVEVGEGTRFYFNSLNVGWYKNLYFGLGIFRFGREGFGLNIPSLNPSSFLIGSAFELINEAIAEGNVLALLGVNQNVRMAYEKEGFLGASLEWIKNMGQKILGLFDGVAEFFDELRFIFDNNPHVNELRNASLLAMKAVTSTNKANYREAEHIMNMILNAKEGVASWVRGFVLTYQHEYWKKRTQPFSSLTTLFDFIFHANMNSNLQKRLEEAENFVEQQNYQSLNAEDKKKYRDYLFYLFFSNKDFDMHEFLNNIEHILLDLYEENPSSVALLGYLINSSFMTISEKNLLTSKLFNMYATTINENNDEKKAKVLLARYLFTSTYGGNSSLELEVFNQGVNEDIIKNELDRVLSNFKDSIFAPPIGNIFAITYLNLLFQTARFHDNPKAFLEDHLKDIYSQYSLEYGFSSITGKAKLLSPVGGILKVLDNYSDIADKIVDLIQKAANGEVSDFEKDLDNLLSNLQNPLLISLFLPYYRIKNPENAKIIDYLLINSLQNIPENIRDVLRRYREYKHSQNKTSLSNKTDETPEFRTDNIEDLFKDFNSFDKKQEILKKARRIALNIESVDESKKERYLQNYLLVEKLSKEVKDERELFLRVVGEKNMYLYENYTVLKRMYPNIDIIKYLATLITYAS